MKTASISALLLLVCIMAVPAIAHHSATMVVTTRTVPLDGVVTKWELTNPHSWLHVEVKDKNGKSVVWGFEAEGPTTLARAGIKPSDFKVGTRIKITGNPMKDGQPAAMWLDAIRESDGKKFNPRAGFAVK